MSDVSQEYRLTRLGLRQEFRREFDFLASFGLSFVISSPLVGLSVGLTYAWETGGPATAIWGWPIGSLSSLIIALSMCEIVSGLPSSGGPFFWTSWLGGKHGPILSYLTGWLNLYGQAGLCSGNASSATSSLVAIASMMTGASLSYSQQFAMQIGILVLSGAINSFQPKTVARFLALGIFINFTSVVFVVLLLPAVAPFHQSSKFVYGTLYNKSQSSINAPSNAYLWVQAPTISLFTIAGYDCCAHLAEETKGADLSTPLAILWSIVAASIVGYVLLLGMLFCVQDPNPFSLLDPNNQAQGYAAGQLVWDVFAARYGSGEGSVSVLSLFALSSIMCTAATLTSASRCLFAFSRSRAFPCSGFCNSVSKRTHMPVRAVWVAVGMASAISVTILESSVAFGSIVAWSYSSLLFSYGIPILCRLTVSRTSFEPGPFHLGSFSAVFGWTAIACILASSVLMCLPTTVPMPVNNSPIWLAIVVASSLAAWFLPRLGVRKHYRDPRRQAAAAAVTHSNLIRTETI